ncbi:MAG: hypothetical protein KW793_01845 [Candidatus Doudnabacteria bacterium]|nr:hypothetical protein [Candidatus Doudnabacteria bacterium]
MRQTKIIIFGIILIGVVVFGTIFWMDLYWNQQEIANTPLPPSPIFDETQRNQATADMSSKDDYDSIEKDLDNTEVENIDSGSSEIEAEASAL